MREYLREHVRETAMHVNRTLLQRHLRETRGNIGFRKKTVNIGFRKLCDVNHVPKNNLSPSCNLCNKKTLSCTILKKNSLSQLCENTLLHTTLKQNNMTLLHKSQPLWCNSLANHSLADHSHSPANQSLASLHLLNQTFSSSKLSCTTLFFFTKELCCSNSFYHPLLL